MRVHSSGAAAAGWHWQGGRGGVAAAVVTGGDPLELPAPSSCGGKGPAPCGQTHARPAAGAPEKQRRRKKKKQTKRKRKTYGGGGEGAAIVVGKPSPSNLQPARRSEKHNVQFSTLRVAPDAAWMPPVPKTVSHESQCGRGACRGGGALRRMRCEGAATGGGPCDAVVVLDPRTLSCTSRSLSRAAPECGRAPLLDAVPGVHRITGRGDAEDSVASPRQPRRMQIRQPRGSAQ
jgi:hypothetical protein